MAAHPDIHVDVTLSDWDTYWDKLQTGLAGGDAPDVFAMDGPLYPDYQSRGVLLDLAPYIARDGFDLTALADAGVAHFTTPEGQFGLPRDLNVVALYYNKAMFDAAGLAYPDDTWTWDKLLEVGKQLTLDTNGDGQTDQWGFYTETTDMENYWSSLVWQNGGDIVSADHTQTLLGSTRRWVASSGSRTSSTPTRSCHPGPVRPDRATPSSRARRRWRPTAPGLCRRTWPRASTWASHRCRRAPPRMPRASIPRASWSPTRTTAPDAAWEFVKYLVGPEAQTQLMQLKAAVPVDKSVLAGSLRHRLPGLRCVRRVHRGCPPEALVPGL